MSGSGVSIEKSYEFNDVFPVYDDQVKRVKPQIYLTFDNKKENKLGMPLPKGIIRLYKEDAKGKTQFIGEDRIDHTPDNETIRLKMGEAFNLTGEMKRANYNKISDKVTQASFEIILKNAGDQAVFVDIKQSFPNGYKLIEQSLEGKKLTSNQVKWKIQVPAKGQNSFTYKVRWN